MKNIHNFILAASIILLCTCEKDKKTISPETFTASQGTYIGVVQLAYDIAFGDGAIHFEVQRWDDINAQWVNIAWTNHRAWGDDAQDGTLPNGIEPGKTYRYRMRAHSEGGGYGEYTDEVTGYAYKADPSAITSVSTEIDEFNKSITVNWINPNDFTGLQNLDKVRYELHRAEKTEMPYFNNIHTAKDYGTNNEDFKKSFSYTDYVSLEEEYQYEIRTFYRYQYTDRNGNFMNNRFHEIAGLPSEYDPGDDPGNGNGDKDIDHGEGVADIDGNEYTTVIIGDQEWMAENLKTSNYNDGTAIPNVSDGNEWVNLETGGYVWYENDVNFADTYGALYNWYAVETGKLCPAGWRVPTDDDWTQLTAYLGGETAAGGKLKDTNHWDSPNEGATNSTGFSAPPGGHRYINASFSESGNQGFWWTADESTSKLAWSRRMHAYFGSVQRIEGEKTEGYSVRCVKGSMQPSPGR